MDHLAGRRNSSREILLALDWLNSLTQSVGGWYTDGWSWVRWLNIQRGKGSCKINKVVVSSAHFYLHFVPVSHSIAFSIFFCSWNLGPSCHWAFAPTLPSTCMFPAWLVHFHPSGLTSSKKSLLITLSLELTPPMIFPCHYINFLVEIYQPLQIDRVFNYLFIYFFSSFPSFTYNIYVIKDLTIPFQYCFHSTQNT